MNSLLSKIKIDIPKGIYLKDPESSDLGKRIVENSIILIEEIGIESFNFKKLGKEIGSNESSIYRYFESKHNLLVYLTSWYWGWIEYQLVLETYSISDKKEKLKKTIEIVTRTTKQDSNYGHVNEVLLNKIIINENSKSFLTKDVDLENDEGYFSPFKRVVTRFAQIISDYNSDYLFPLSLSDMIIEGAIHQHFTKMHFQSITNIKKQEEITGFFTDLTFKTLDNGK